MIWNSRAELLLNYNFLPHFHAFITISSWKIVEASTRSTCKRSVCAVWQEPFYQTNRLLGVLLSITATNTRTTVSPFSMQRLFSLFKCSIQPLLIKLFVYAAGGSVQFGQVASNRCWIYDKSPNSNRLETKETWSWKNEQRRRTQITAKIEDSSSSSISAIIECSGSSMSKESRRKEQQEAQILKLASVNSIPFAIFIAFNFSWRFFILFVSPYCCSVSIIRIT